MFWFQLSWTFLLYFVCSFSASLCLELWFPASFKPSCKTYNQIFNAVSLSVCSVCSLSLSLSLSLLSLISEIDVLLTVACRHNSQRLHLHSANVSPIFFVSKMVNQTDAQQMYSRWTAGAQLIHNRYTTDAQQIQKIPSRCTPDAKQINSWCTADTQQMHSRYTTDAQQMRNICLRPFISLHSRTRLILNTFSFLNHDHGSSDTIMHHWINGQRNSSRNSGKTRKIVSFRLNDLIPEIITAHRTNRISSGERKLKKERNF